MEQERFEALVDAAINSLPDDIMERLDNVEILVADKPTRSQMRHSHPGHGYMLMGLYEGVPQTQRTGYNMVLPDKITIFKNNIEAACRTDAEVEAEIRRVALHEIAHHFGIGDGRLRDMGRY